MPPIDLLFSCRNYFPRHQAAENSLTSIPIDDQTSIDPTQLRNNIPQPTTPFPVQKIPGNRPPSQPSLPFTPPISSDIQMQPGMMPFHALTGMHFIHISIN